MVHLPTHPAAGGSSPKPKRGRARRALKAVMRSHRMRIPKYDMPIRLRPWFLVFTCVVMLILAFLGFTNFSRSLPMNDKLLHFLCLGFATGIFYFIFDVEDDARRIWFWRNSPLIFTGVACFFFGGIVSEIVQSLLPYKEFQSGDVVANLLGSSIGLYVAYYLERYYRHRREISRLYRPLDADYVSDSDSEADEFDERGAPLLPTHYSPGPSSGSPSLPKGTGGKAAGQAKAVPVRMSNVWDEREELFDVGGDSGSEDEGAAAARSTRVAASPTIVITPSS